MKFKYRRYFFKWTPGLLIILWMRSVKFKKWDNVSLYKIIKLFVRDLTENEILIRANGVAFSFILAIFPAIIFLFKTAAVVDTQVFRQVDLKNESPQNQSTTALKRRCCDC
jgi:membrane protein